LIAIKRTVPVHQPHVHGMGFVVSVLNIIGIKVENQGA
jgi:hypothetical protein